MHGQPPQPGQSRRGDDAADDHQAPGREQLFDLIVAIAKLNESLDYLRPLFETALAGLRAPQT
ncbi:hypothetical protein ABZ599_35615 [Streptomyces misionensis]|uniref:hypothetical protein n=1 Tax=Streptomyces misionensis TaxID=67331 RepID=UPI0033D0CA87